MRGKYAGRGFAERTVNQIIKLATDGIKPDLTLFFDISVDKAILRTNSRSNDEAIKNRMDAETREFYERVRTAYLRIADAEKKRFQVIDANGSVEEIKAKVLEIITQFLNG